MIDEYFLFLHRNMPRQGPGSSRSTGIAASFLPRGDYSSILDIGCGPGMQTMDLARLFKNSRVTGMDYYPVFLDQLEMSCRERGIGNVVTANGSMRDLSFQSGAFDLIWSEAAIYIMGFEKGLREWRGFLRQEGCLAVSELTWLSSRRPSRITDYWEDNYPDMKDIPGNLKLIEKSGYRLIGLYVLPPEDWNTHYYNPLMKNLKKEQGRPLTEDQMNCLELEFLEIQMHREFADHYSYVFYVMQRN